MAREFLGAFKIPENRDELSDEERRDFSEQVAALMKARISNRSETAKDAP